MLNETESRKLKQYIREYERFTYGNKKNPLLFTDDEVKEKLDNLLYFVDSITEDKDKDNG